MNKLRFSFLLGVFLSLRLINAQELKESKFSFIGYGGIGFGTVLAPDSGYNFQHDIYDIYLK